MVAFGVDTCCQILREDIAHVAVENRGVGVGSERVVVGYEEEALGVILEFDEIAKCSEVVAQMELTCRANATQYFFSHNIVYILINYSSE